MYIHCQKMIFIAKLPSGFMTLTHTEAIHSLQILDVIMIYLNFRYLYYFHAIRLQKPR